MNQETHSADLLTEGIAAAHAGDHAAALRLLRRVTELDPANVEAWVWRASVAESTADKKAFLEQALALDPDHVEAKLALERVLEREGDLAAPTDEPLFCTVHPDRETGLRCNRCGRPMCTECAVRHPVGLRCRECVAELRSPIYKVGTGTTALALGAATAIGAIVGLLVILFGGIIGFFWIFIGAAIGGAVGNGVQRVVPRKRGRPMQVAVAGGMVLGLVLAAAGLALVVGGPAALVGGTIGFLFQLHTLLYLATAIAAAAATLR